MAEENVVKEKYYPIPEGDPDYEPGKYDCVKEIVDRKGRYWTSTTVFRDPENEQV